MSGDLSTDGGYRRERGDKMMFFSACDEKNVGGLQKKCTENCCGGDFTNIIFRAVCAILHLRDEIKYSPGVVNDV